MLAGPNATVSVAINGSSLSSLSVAFPGSITMTQIGGYIGFKWVARNQSLHAPLEHSTVHCLITICLAGSSCAAGVHPTMLFRLKYSAAADGLQLGSIILGATLSIPAISFTAASTITIVDFNTVTITVGRSQCVV